VDLSERGAADAPRHPWEVARARFFVALLAGEGCLAHERWLDVGAGDAWFSTQLLAASSPGHRVVAWDAFYSPEDLAVTPADPRLSLVADQPDERFGGLLLMDVVEHVADDVEFVRSIVQQNLEPDGSVLVTVPAYQRLFSAHDVALGHYRRYHPDQCRALLAAADLRVVRQGGLFQTLLAARGALVLAERLRGRATRRDDRGPDSPQSGQRGIGSWSGGERLGRAIAAGLTLEARVSRAVARRGRSIPGLTYWALCTGPE
jgi:2-polyprenyl-3-methyl-5-hydroxy-6-metoxy-1,4-benzoquinol methylase